MINTNNNKKKFKLQVYRFKLAEYIMLKGTLEFK